MRYLSTRGGDERLSFEETVLTGLAPNGGLYIPANMPVFPPDWEQDWRELSFQDLALEICSLFIGSEEISRSDLKSLVDKSYASFRCQPAIAPFHKLSDRQYVLELFHGPTFAFKDVALQFVGNLFEYFLARRNKGKSAGEARERLTVVGATSGDTGSAAIYGLRGKQDVSIFILHPKGRVSPIQEAQMTTVTDANVFNLAVKGTFDDCQDIVKALFADAPFNARYHLGAVNSINWARILAQITYYFSSYFAIKREQPNAKYIQYVVPTGNFGDILAGWYARRLGLPVSQTPMVIATNENDILQRFWATGRYEKAAETATTTGSTQTEPVAGSSDGSQGGVKQTLSPAMDILVSSNFERLLWYLALETQSASAVVDYDEKGEVDGGAAAKIRLASQVLKGWMDELKTKGRFVVAPEVLAAARQEFIAERVSDQETSEIIKRTYVDSSYTIDPHTAVGLCAATRIESKLPADAVQICLATAHPAKFSEAVEHSLKSEAGFNFENDVLPPEFKGLLDKTRRVIDVSGPKPALTKEVIEREVARLWGEKVEGALPGSSV